MKGFSQPESDMCRADTWHCGNLKLQMLKWFMDSMCLIKTSPRVLRVHVWENRIVIYNDVCIGALKCSQAYTRQRKGHTHMNTTLTHAQPLKCIWTCFKRPQKLEVFFAHVCCADIHIHGVHMLLSKNTEYFCLLSPSKTDDIHQENSFRLYHGLQAARLTDKNNKCVHVVLNCLGLKSVHFQQLNNGMPVQPRVCLNGVWVLKNTCNLLGIDEKSEQRENAFRHFLPK